MADREQTRRDADAGSRYIDTKWQEWRRYEQQTPHARGFSSWLLAELEQVEHREVALVEALRFYADRTNWGVSRDHLGPRVIFLTIHEPPMKRAEDALAAYEQEHGVPS